MEKNSNFEKKLQKAKELLEKLSNPSISLEDSVKYYKDGVKTLKEASTMLENAKIEFEKLSKIDEDN